MLETHGVLRKEEEGKLVLGGRVLGKARQEGLGFEQGRDLEEEGSHVAECQIACLYFVFVFQQCQRLSSCI